MRSILALVLAFPIYNALLNDINTENTIAFGCCMLLQLLAGLDFTLREK